MNTSLALGVLTGSGFLLSALSAIADQVPVRHLEGRIHGFLVLRDVDGNLLASGTSIQVSNGTVVTNELALRFRDGSMHQETTVFSQNRQAPAAQLSSVSKGVGFPARHEHVRERLHGASHDPVHRR